MKTNRFDCLRITDSDEVSDTVKAAMEELIKDVLALSREEYLDSIKKTRRGYREGRFKHFEEVFNVKNCSYPESIERSGRF